MVPIVNVNADILHSIWKSVLSQISKIGFDIAVTITDGHSSNMPLIKKKVLKSEQDLFVYNEDKRDSKIFPIYDNTHLFKNFYNK